jgi:hypothetical protein
MKNSSNLYLELTLHPNYDYRESSLELIYPVNRVAIANSKVLIENILTRVSLIL